MVDAATLQLLLDDAAARLGIVGAAAAVWSGGELVEAATGVANAERALLVTTDTLFQIGSTTKVYNAALVMQLVDEGALELDEPVRTYIPGFRLSDRQASRTVTLRHLLSMSSGIDNGPYRIPQGEDRVARYVELVANLPHLFSPGTAFGYSNAGTIIAGHAVERVADRCWEDELRDRLLVPAGLHESVSLCEELVYHRVAVGHVATGKRGHRVVRPWHLGRARAPAGSTLCASAGDLARFGRLLLNAGTTEDGTQVLSARAIQTMCERQIQPAGRGYSDWWGLGPSLREWGEVELWGHGGTTLNGSSKLTWIPSHDIVVATVTNVPATGYPLHDVVLGSVAAAENIVKPPPPQSVDWSEIDLDRYIGTFVATDTECRVVESKGVLSLIVAMNVPGQPRELTSSLVPLGRDRFLPENPHVATGRDWDIAFWGDDGHGLATNLLYGVFPTKRLDMTR